MDIGHLCSMANQIARNFAVQGDTAATAATAQHIRAYWDPRMKAAIFNASDELLSPIARQAINQLRSDATAQS